MRVKDGEQKSIFDRIGEFEDAEGRVWRFRVQGKVLFRHVGETVPRFMCKVTKGSYAKFSENPRLLNEMLVD